MLCFANFALSVYDFALIFVQASRTERERILRAFIAKNQCKTGPELEHEFRNGASLFLTRLCAYMKTCVSTRTSVGLTFQAISVFVSSASGTRFLQEFLDVGGLEVVVETIRDESSFEVILLPCFFDAQSHSLHSMPNENYADGPSSSAPTRIVPHKLWLEIQTTPGSRTNLRCSRDLPVGPGVPVRTRAGTVPHRPRQSGNRLQQPRDFAGRSRRSASMPASARPAHRSTGGSSAPQSSPCWLGRRRSPANCWVRRRSR